MPEPRMCLRCGERPATADWQCAECVESFADWEARDWHGALTLLDEQARWLERSADRLDGAGFWAAAKAVSQAAEAVDELARAIDELGADAGRAGDEVVRPRGGDERARLLGEAAGAERTAELPPEEGREPRLREQSGLFVVGR